MAEDGATGVLELPGTGAALESPPEAAGLVETEFDAAVETVGDGVTAETEDGSEEADPLGELDDDSLANNERIKQLMEKHAEWRVSQERDRITQRANLAANEKAREARAIQAQQAADGSAAQEFLLAIRADLQDDEWTWGKNASAGIPKALEKYGAFYRTQQALATEQGAAAFVQDVLKEPIPPDLNQYLVESRADPNPAQLSYAWAYTITQIADRKAYERGRADEAAERAEKDKTDVSKGATATRKANAPRPASGAAGAVAPVRDPRDIIADPRATAAQKRAAYKSVYGFDP